MVKIEVEAENEFSFTWRVDNMVKIGVEGLFDEERKDFLS